MLLTQIDVAKYHQQMEGFTRRWLENFHTAGKTIHCRSQCANCCSMAVHTTFPEAALIASSLDHEQNQQLKTYVQKLLQVAATFPDLRSYLRQHREEMGPCPFLTKDACCGIYALRPLSCRALLSTRTADWCAIDISRLDKWDKQLYEESLDLQVISWPTHYVAATRDFGHHLETELLAKQKELTSWSLSGNLPLLVWLGAEKKFAAIKAGGIASAVTALELKADFLLELNN